MVVYRDFVHAEMENFIKVLAPKTEDRAAFFANLLQPSLSAFERYVGFKAALERTGLSQRDIAKQAGIPASTVSHLLCLDRLPEQLLAILRIHPLILTSYGANELALALKEGCTIERAEELLNELATTGMSEKEARKRLQNHRELNNGDVQLVRRLALRSGNAIRCKLQSAKLDLRLTFKDESECRWAEREIARLLREKYPDKVK